MTIRVADVEPAPDVFAVVMATGILSIAARDHHYFAISDTLGVLATLGLLLLVTVVIVTAAAKRGISLWDLTDPDVTLRLFTFVAACAVLDSRLASHRVVLQVLGVVAASAWLALVVLTARNMAGQTWGALRQRAHGAWELASVGTAGLAIVATTVARNTVEHWWLWLAVPVWVVALCSYGLMTWLIVWRAVTQRQEPDLDGEVFAPDTWILMGGLAIGTLAGDLIHGVAPAWLSRPVLMVTVVTWAAATLWISPLIYFGVRRISRRPGALHFTGVWWAFVFPLGMYSAATYAMAAELGQHSLLTVSLVFFWDAVAAWLIVVVAGLMRAWAWRRNS